MWDVLPLSLQADDSKVIWRSKSGSLKLWGFYEILTKRNYFLAFAIIKYSSFQVLDVPSSATVYQPCKLNTVEEETLSQPLKPVHVLRYTHTRHELSSSLSLWSPHICADVQATTMKLPLRLISKSVSLHIFSLHLEAARKTLVVKDSVTKWPLTEEISD